MKGRKHMEKFFKLKENGTNVSTEIMAGITTFMTMAYILAVNPNILSASGMDRGAVFTATALSAFIATCLMALLSNYPFVLAPGMGLNAYFAYTVVLGMGYTWQAALAAVFVEGIIFIVLSLTNVREAIFNAIPMNLKHAVSVGIGLFIAFIGLQNAKIVVNNDSTLLGLFSFKGSVQAGTFNYEGITVLLALIGILITAIFLIKNVKGGILCGILITWGLGIICQFTGLYVPNADAGFYSLLPDFSSGFSIPALTPTLMKMDFSIVFSLDFVVIMFAFLFVDMFDTLGTLIGVASKADMLDKDGKLPNIRGALLADAVGTSVGAMFGTSTRNQDELKNLFRKSLRLIGTWGIMLALLSQLLAAPLSKLFVGYDAELFAMTEHGFRIYCLAYLINGFNIFGSSFFTALNNGVISAAISFLRTLVFQIIMILLLPTLLGINGIWSAVGIAELMTLCVTITFFIKQRKKYLYV